MLPRTSTPPTGPRGPSPGGRGRGRGGVQKHRNGPPRPDKDGDLMMEPVMDNEASFSRVSANGGRTRGRAAGRAGHIAGTAHGAFSTPQAQQAIIRGLASQGNTKETRTGQRSAPEYGHSGEKRGRGGQHSSDVSLRVYGLNESKAAGNPDGGVKDLLGFLERKANGIGSESHSGVRIKKSYKEGDCIIITASPDDASRILKLNSFKFAGTSLVIETNQSPSHPVSKKEPELSTEARKTQDRIRGILSTRYDVNLKLLNLSQLGQDPELQQMGMFDAKNRVSKLFPVMMVVCDRLFESEQQKREAVVSVTLANNDLDGVAGVTTLAQTFPDLQNLDLSHNKISNLRALEGWRSKFRGLKNLRMLHNPIETTTPGYLQELAKWFPTLHTLNDVQIRTPEEALAIANGPNPHPEGNTLSPIPISGPDFRDVNQIGEGFVRQFFTLYDTDRNKLINTLYDEQSTYSLSINISAPRSSHQTQSPPFPRAAFKASRNLSKLPDLSSQISRLHHGASAIRSLWNELPATKHPDMTTETAKYLVDCHPMSGLPDPKHHQLQGCDGLMVMTHGEFEERDGSTSVRRSFSRTFVLGPGPALGGPLIRVVSDIVVLRAWSPLVTASSSLSQPQLQLQQLPQQQPQQQQQPLQPGPNTGPVLPMGSSVGAGGLLDPRQRDMLAQLVGETGMTPEYASLCLVETGWDLDKARLAFLATKSKLPPQAFTGPINHS